MDVAVLVFFSSLFEEPPSFGVGSKPLGNWDEPGGWGISAADSYGDEEMFFPIAARFERVWYVVSDLCNAGGAVGIVSVGIASIETFVATATIFVPNGSAVFGTVKEASLDTFATGVWFSCLFCCDSRVHCIEVSNASKSKASKKVSTSSSSCFFSAATAREYSFDAKCKKVSAPSIVLVHVFFNRLLARWIQVASRFLSVNAH